MPARGGSMNTSMAFALELARDKAQYNELKNKEEKGLTHLLNTLFSAEMPVEEKKRILSEDYGIAMTREKEEDMGDMCNLADGIWENGYEKGLERGRQETIQCGEFVRLVKQIRSKLLRGKSIDDIADALEEKSSFIQSMVDIIRANPNLTDIEVAKQYL